MVSRRDGKPEYQYIGENIKQEDQNQRKKPFLPVIHLNIYDQLLVKKKWKYAYGNDNSTQSD